MLAVIILLEEDVGWREEMILEGGKEAFFKNRNILFGVDLPLNSYELSKPEPRHTPPDHYTPTAILLVSIDIAWIKSLPMLPPDLTVSIRPMEVEL